MNKIKICFFIMLAISQTKNLYSSTATVDGLKKLITKFAEEDKSYITLYAAELGLDYDNYLATRRKQNCLEIKNYVLLFSPSLTGDMLAGKIDQDKLDWVNNICPGLLPKTTGYTASTSTTDNATTPANNTNGSPTTVSNTSANNTSPLIKKDAVKAFHAIKVD